MKTIERYPENINGRDFICGDIHGCFSYVERAMDDVGFDTGVDRLFCTGDLVDRGPDSEDAVWWWRQPWFHAVVGNHELFLIENYKMYGMQPIVDQLWRCNGGAWWQELFDERRKEFAEEVAALPYMVEIITPTMRVGIVHAQLPTKNWDECVELVGEGRQDIIDDMMWGRDRVQRNISDIVEDVDYVFCGHTIQKTPKLFGNHWFIDTGAFVRYWGREGYGLTLIELE